MIKLLKQIQNCILFAIFLGVFNPAFGSTETILINCNIIDGTGKPVAKNMVITISENKINQIKVDIYLSNDCIEL